MMLESLGGWLTLSNKLPAATLWCCKEDISCNSLFLTRFSSILSSPLSYTELLSLRLIDRLIDFMSCMLPNNSFSNWNQWGDLAFAMARRDWLVTAHVFPAPPLLFLLLFLSHSERYAQKWIHLRRKKNIFKVDGWGKVFIIEILASSVFRLVFLPMFLLSLVDDSRVETDRKDGRGRRDDMWQRLHARLAGTQHASESSKAPQHHQTPWFIALAPAPRGIIQIILQERCEIVASLLFYHD